MSDASGTALAGTSPGRAPRVAGAERLSTERSLGDEKRERHDKKRAVARRACLNCREKKIKCDGEALPGAVCLNCKFLSVPCVFVQSMRGGKRRRRSEEASESPRSVSSPEGARPERVPKSDARRGGNMALPVAKVHRCDGSSAVDGGRHRLLSEAFPAGLNVIAAKTPGRLPPPWTDAWDAPFLDAELAAYGLPPWTFLAPAVDFYFRYIHPNHQLLANKAHFLAHTALKTDALVLYALVAVVCTRRPWLFHSHEAHWIGLAHQRWDTLGAHGALLCCSLLRYTLAVRNNHRAMVQLCDRFHDISHANKHLLARPPQHGVTARQRYEHELAVRMLWLYYIDNIVVLRVRQGPPYPRLLTLRPSNVLVGLDPALAPWPLPVRNEAHATLESTDPLAWLDVEAGSYDSFTALIAAAVRLDAAANAVEKGAPPRRAPALEQFLAARTTVVREKLLLVDAQLLVASCMVHHAALLTHTHSLGGVLQLAPCHGLLSPLAPVPVEKQVAAFAALSGAQCALLAAVMEAAAALVDLLAVGLGAAPAVAVLYGIPSLEAVHDTAASDFVSNGTDTWLKYDDAFVYASNVLLTVLPGLMQLRLHTEPVPGTDLCLRLHAPPLEHVVPWSGARAFFTVPAMAARFGTVVDFLRFRVLYECNYLLQQDAIASLNTAVLWVDALVAQSDRR